MALHGEARKGTLCDDTSAKLFHFLLHSLYSDISKRRVRNSAPVGGFSCEICTPACLHPQGGLDRALTCAFWMLLAHLADVRVSSLS